MGRDGERATPPSLPRRTLLHGALASAVAGCCPHSSPPLSGVSAAQGTAAAAGQAAATGVDERDEVDAAGAADPPARWRLCETVPRDTVLASPHPTIAEVWRQLIDGAERRVELSHFYFAEKAPSKLTPVIDALQRARAREVRVRLLLDRKMAALYPEAVARLGGALDIRLLDAASLMGGVQHAKYMLVDDRELFIGSANLDWRALEHIHELGVQLTSAPLTAALRDVFERDWSAAGGQAPPALTASWPLPAQPIEDGRLQLALSPRDHLPHESAWDLPQLQALLDGARQRIQLQLLSLQPHFRDGRRFERLHQALRAAVARGVRVQVLLSHWETRTERLLSLKQLVRDGVQLRICTIAQLDGGFIPFARVIHAKYLLVDERHSWLGTSNWDGDYFHHSRNVGIVANSLAFSRALSAVFQRMWSCPYSRELDPNKSYPEPRIG